MSDPDIPRTALVTGGSRGLGVAIAIRQLDLGKGRPGSPHSVLGMEARLRRHGSPSGCPGSIPPNLTLAPPGPSAQVQRVD
jgi:hypothetical protein